MARDKILTDDQREFIANIKQKIPELTAGEVTGAVWSYLVLEAEKTNPNLDDEDISRIENEQLSESAIIGFLTDLNNKIKVKALKSIDKEWTLATLKDKEWTFLPESMMYLLKIKEWCNRKTIHFSIRQALWVSRLYALPHHQSIKSGGLKALKDRLILPDAKALEDLWRIGYFLAAYDVSCELAGTPFDYRPFEAPSIALMVKQSREYLNNHHQEMAEAFWYVEINGEGEDK